MAALYKKYIDFWTKLTDGNLMMFAGDIFTYGRYGCWGLSEYLSQDTSKAPKLRAVRPYL